ncbi:MAG: hypothetical protein AAF645_23905 [Myxococcota bacterium]
MTLVVPFAQAQESSSRRRLPLRLEMATCASIPAEEVRRIVAIELRGRLAEPTAPIGETTRASVTCDGPVQITVDDPITGKQLLRTIALRDDEPEVRARVLALAVVELVSASWAELVANPEPVVEPARITPVSARAVETAAEIAREQEDRAFEVGGYASLRALGGGFPLGPLRAFGGGLRIGVRLLERLTIFADADLDFGRRNFAFGNVRLERYGGSVGVLYDVWGAPLGGWFGASLSAASVRLTGGTELDAVEDDISLGAFLSANVEGGLRLRWNWFFVALSLEVGVPLLYPVAAVVDQGVGSSEDVSPSKLWLGGALGVGVVL